MEIPERYACDGVVAELAVGMLVRSRAVELNSLHRSWCRCSPLGRLHRSWWWLWLLLRLLLLLLEWGQYVGGRCWRVGVLLSEQTSHAAVDVGAAGIETTKLLPDGRKFIAQQLALFLCSSAVLGVRSQSCIFSARSVVGSTQVLDILDRLGQYLPLAGFAPRRIRQNIIQLVKEILHLAPALPLGHFVADSEFGCPAIIPAARRGQVLGLKTGNAPMLHRVMMSSGHVIV